MTYDICTFNGEFDILEIRLNVLKDHVDKFIIVEFDKTFSGKPKPAYYLEQQDRFKGFNIEYFNFGKIDYGRFRELAENSPNTKGAEHWKTEFMMKESIKLALRNLEDDDIIYIGDVDEIWNPDEAIPFHSKLRLKVYTYWLNNRSSEEFAGPIKVFYSYLEDKCLNELRSRKSQTTNYYGWHFTSMGGYEEVKRKLSNSYTKESYWTEGVENHLAQNIAQNKDFLGRNFTYRQDESEWPQYLKENKEKYKHLLIP